MSGQGVGVLLTSYLRSLEARRMSPVYIASVRNTLLAAERSLGKQLDYMTPADLRRWQEERAREVSERSLRTYISQVRNAFLWAVEEGLLREDPSTRLRPPRVGQTLPRPIPETRLLAAYEAADKRMRAMLTLAAWAGLRCCEIASLTWADVYLDGPTPYLHVRGKGKKERTVALSDDLRAVLEDLPHRKGPVIRRSDRLPGHNTSNRVSHMLNDHLHAHGAPDTAHSLRHRALTEACRVGGVRQAQEFAGHSSPAVTGVYTKVLQSDLRPTVMAIGRFLLDEQPEPEPAR